MKNSKNRICRAHNDIPESPDLIIITPGNIATPSHATSLYHLFQDLTLHFVVLSFDRYSRDDVIGELMVDLDGLGVSSDEQPVAIAREITPRSFKVKRITV